MKKLFYLSLILLFLTSCGRSNKELKNSEPKMLQKQNKEKIISEMMNKYPIEYSLDTLDYIYSIEFQRLLSTEYQIVSNFGIQDIYIKDSLSYVKITIGIFPTYYFDLKISDIDRDKLLKLGNLSYFQANAVMVVSLHKVRKIDLKIIGYPDGPDNYSIEFDNSLSFAGEGEVISVQILN